MSNIDPMTAGDHATHTVEISTPKRKRKPKDDSLVRGKDTPLPPGVKLEDFYAYMPMHSYIYKLTGEMWPAVSINSRLPKCSDEDGKEMAPNAWLDRHRPVEQMSWAPGQPKLIEGRIVADGGWIEHEGVRCFNLYRPPAARVRGDASKAGPWIDHVSKVYPEDGDHIIKWLAHRVQRPHEKINHAVVLGGAPGIGKDTIFEPIKHAVGPWNFAEVSPSQMMGRFNAYLKSIILRVSEARDLGEVSRYQFYEHSKTISAAPPDVHRVDEKHLREHSVFNVCGVCITTNYGDGLYLPRDDRRHYVAWSPLMQDDFEEGYWDKLWGWYRNGGIEHVAAYLAELDLSTFNPKAPPEKTEAFWKMCNANLPSEEGELADAIDGMGATKPDAFTLDRLARAATAELAIWIKDRKNRRNLTHRLDACGYEPVRNTDAKDNLWKINGKRQTIFAAKDLTFGERTSAARKLSNTGDYEQ